MSSSDQIANEPYVHLRDERGRLLPGQPSLGPEGRPAIADGGKPNVSTMARRMIEDNIIDVIKVMLENALAGDMTTANNLLARVTPALKSIDHTGLNLDTLPVMQINKTTTVIEVQADTDQADTDQDSSSTDEQTGQELECGADNGVLAPTEENPETDAPIDTTNNGT